MSTQLDAFNSNPVFNEVPSKGEIAKVPSLGRSLTIKVNSEEPKLVLLEADISILITVKPVRSTEPV